MEKHGLRPWTSIQREKAWKWAGKVAQAADERWTATIASWTAHGDRPRGRPKARWADTFNTFLTGVTGTRPTQDDWRPVAKDVEKWAALSSAYVAFADLDQPNNEGESDGDEDAADEDEAGEDA